MLEQSYERNCGCNTLMRHTTRSIHMRITKAKKTNRCMRCSWDSDLHEQIAAGQRAVGFVKQRHCAIARPNRFHWRTKRRNVKKISSTHSTSAFSSLSFQAIWAAARWKSERATARAGLLPRMILYARVFPHTNAHQHAHTRAIELRQLAVAAERVLVHHAEAEHRHLARDEHELLADAPDWIEAIVVHHFGLLQCLKAIK